MTAPASPPRGRRNHAPLASRAGFSLVEIMVSMTLMAIAMSSLATLAYAVAERGRANDIVTKRNFALQQQANRFGAMSYTDLSNQSTGSTTMLLGDFTFTRTLSITNTGTNRYTIKIVIAPALDDTKTDSVTFDRTHPATVNPLCATC